MDVVNMNDVPKKSSDKRSFYRKKRNCSASRC